MWSAVAWATILCHIEKDIVCIISLLLQRCLLWHGPPGLCHFEKIIVCIISFLLNQGCLMWHGPSILYHGEKDVVWTTFFLASSKGGPDEQTVMSVIYTDICFIS